MKVIDRINSKMREVVKKWLDIRPAPNYKVTINEPLSFETSVLRNLIWYRGEGEEIEQFFQSTADTTLARQRFWAASDYGEGIRKAHSGLPGVMADNLSQMIATDMQTPEFFGREAERNSHRWENIRADNNFPKLLTKCIKDVLVTGDGAFKVNIDSATSEYPIIEFYDASRVEYRRKNGRITEIIFLSYHTEKDKEYTLKEYYGKNKIYYRLFEEEKEVPLARVEALKDLKPVEFTGGYIMAVPVMVWPSSKFSGRGKSIYEGKTDSFDSLDEIISQWMDAIRAGRVKNYIPTDLIPRGEKGNFIMPSSFGTNFIKISSPNTENADPKIETVQPEIRYEAFLQSYATMLDSCLQGVISPATLGINIGKMSSDEAQREKKDITGVTRNAVTRVLEQAIPRLIEVCLMTEDTVLRKIPGNYELSVSFGEYGAPSFDSRIKTVSRAMTNGIMSTEAAVDELWGNSKDREWKQAEVQRILHEKGIETVEEPSVGAEALW